MSETILITGANRGLGLALTQLYAEAGARIIATCRSPENALELNRLAASTRGRVSSYPLDVTNARQIRALNAALADEAVDVLLHNAGVFGQGDASFGNTDPEDWLQTMRVNTVAPLKLTEALVERVAASNRRIVAAMSSKLGSMAADEDGGWYPYRSSKAALNGTMKAVSADLAPRGITTVMLHPGWVRTAMGGPNARITPEESARGLKSVLDDLGPSDNGRFLDYRGNPVPW